MKLGDIVSVVGAEYTFTAYSDMARKMRLTNWNTCRVADTDEFYEVIGIQTHGYIQHCIVVAIQGVKTGDQYLIDIDGLGEVLKEWLDKPTDDDKLQELEDKLHAARAEMDKAFNELLLAVGELK